MNPVRVLRSLACALAAVALVAGCSTGSVSQSDLEQEVSTELEKQVGQAPDDVSCPGDLEAEVGATMECTLTAGEDEVGFTVEVSSVDGSDVGFDIQVDDEVKQ